MMSVFSNNRFLKRVNPEIVRAKDDSGSSLNHPDIQKLMRQMVDMKYTIPILESGWGSSGYGDYVFFHNNHPDIYQFEEYKNISVNTTGNYVYVGRNYPPNGTFPHILYVEVPSNVGVTANDVASFETYLAANSIVIKRCIADNLKLWVHNGLVKTRTSGSDLFVTKAYDISGEENDAVQATTSYQPKLVSDGMEFDGSDDYLEVNDDESLQITEITVAVWVKANNLIDNIPTVISKYDYGINERSWAIRLRRPTGRFRVMLGAEDGNSISKQYEGETVVVDGTWHHLLFTFKQDSLQLYADGQKEETTINDDLDYTVNNLNTANGVSTTIGAYLNSGARDRILNGNVNDSRIFNKVLSASEISAIYNASKGFYGIT